MNKTFAVISILIIIVIFLALAVVYLKPFSVGGEKKILTVSGTTFEVGVASDAASRMKGLSGRTSLGENKGLLFIFPTPGNYGFWMKGMNFPIDIVWIRSGSPSEILFTRLNFFQKFWRVRDKTWEGKVVGVSENLQPEPRKTIFTLPIYYPPANVDWVLEVNAGMVSKYGIKEGNVVELR